MKNPWIASFLALFLTTALVVGCSSDNSDNATEATDTETSTSASGETTEADGDVTTEEVASCGALSVAEAFAQNIGEVPVFAAPWASTPVSTDSYDPCADLSGMLAMQTGANTSSAQQLLLFHKDQFIGTAAEPLTRPVLSRLNDSTLQIQTHTIPTARTPETVAETYTYQWDGENNRLLLHVGADFALDDANNGANLDNDADTTDGVTPYTTGIPAAAKQMFVTKTDQWSGTFHIIQTPSGNIGCTVESAKLLCTIREQNPDAQISYNDAQIYNSISITDGHALLTSKSDVPSWLPGYSGNRNDPQPESVPYGTAVTNGRFVCLSEYKGLTCWDSQTGAGGSLSREGMTVHN